jgi:hypothetical protein
MKAVQLPGILGKTLRNHCIRVLGDMLKNTGISGGSFLRLHLGEQWHSFYGLRRENQGHTDVSALLGIATIHTLTMSKQQILLSLEKPTLPVGNNLWPAKCSRYF